MDAFEAAAKSGDSQGMLAKQRDLLAEADSVEQNLVGEPQYVAEQVRSALSAVRDGARGDLGRLGEARRSLGQLQGAASATPDAAHATGTPAVDVARATDSLRQSLDAFRAALRDQRTDQLLPAQQKLLQDLAIAERAAQSDSSSRSDSLRSAIADIKNGLSGDPALLDTASAKLGGAEVATPGAAPDTQLQLQARSLSQKLDALDEALKSGDQQRILTQQREALRELASLEQALQTASSEEANDLKSATSAIRQGLNGDVNKIAEGRRKLAEALGSPLPTPAGTPTAASGGSANLNEASRGLRENLESFRQAEANGDTNRLMRLQSDLMSQVAEVEASVAGDNSAKASQLRSALQDIRSGLAGDTGKLESARTKLLAIENQR